MPYAAAAPAQPDSTDGGLVNAHEYLTPEERQEREALKARLRERVQYQQVSIRLLTIPSRTAPERVAPRVDRRVARCDALRDASYHVYSRPTRARSCRDAFDASLTRVHASDATYRVSIIK